MDLSLPNQMKSFAGLPVILMGFALLAPTADAGTLAYYRFEDSPGFLVDSSSFGDLGNSGGTHYTLPSSGQGAFFGVPQGSGSNAKGVDLDASTDILDSGNTGTDLITGDVMTAEAMFNFESGGTYSIIAGQWHWQVSERAFQLFLQSSGGARYLAMAVSPDGSANTTVSSGLRVLPNEDYYGAATFDGSEIVFYLKQNPGGDGPTRTSVVVAPYDTMNGHDRLGIGDSVGAPGGGNNFVGVIDEVRISDTVLGPADLLVPVNNSLPTTVAHWRFEDSPGFTNDSSSTGLNLINTAAAQYTLPGSGAGSDFSDPVPRTGDTNAKGAQFDNSSDLMETGNSGITPLTDDFTVEAFINNDFIEGSRNTIVSQWDYTVNKRVFQFTIEGGVLKAYISTTGADSPGYTSSLSITDDKDYYVALVFDLDGGDVTFYAQNLSDGGTLQSDTVAHTHTELIQDDRFVVGGGVSATANNFRGVIDEVRISRAALPVKSLLISKGLVSHWTGDNTSEDSVSTNHGTLVDNATYAAGMLDQAFSLDGSGDYVNIPDNDASLDVDRYFTQSVWFNGDSLPASGTDAIFLQGVDNLQGGNNYIRANNQVLSYGVRTSGTITGPTSLSNSTWYHGVLTYDGTTIRLYLDGAEEANGTTTIDYVNDSRVALGPWVNPVDGLPHSCCYFDGLIDDAALWDVPLTANEVKCLFDVGDSGDLGYTAKDFEELREVHVDGSGSVTVGGFVWTYSSGLTAAAGLSGSSPTFTLVFDDAADTGLTSVASGLPDITVIKFE